jgi:hypothetical protein
LAAIALLAGVFPLGLSSSAYATGPTKPAPKAAAPSKPAAPAKAASSTPGHTNTGGSSGTKAGGNNTGAKAGGGAAAHTPTVTRDREGNTTTRTRSGGEVTKNSAGRVTSVKTANGSEAKFGSNGKVKEVHTASGMTVKHGPGGVRRVEVERADHSRLVAEGHGRGYIQRPYSYGGHAYYSRAYYYHGGYYRGYYRGYYYHGGYYNGYMPAYYYPPAYYGWAYNPWPAPVPYAWGWGGNPWYGYYGAYFAPYPVYPSAAFWLTDYLVAASLANAYAAAAAAGDSALLSPDAQQKWSAPHLVFASYDPVTAKTSPTMTPEVKDAVAEEIKNELAAQKAKAGSDANVASLETLLADGKPHVFVASAGLTVTSAGQDCGLTEGDVLKLPAAPGADATGADLQVLASKKADCPKDSTVTVQLTDLQEMYNNLLGSIDKGMAEMKDNPGKGGLPAPPAEAIAGTKEAPYAAAAPAADPNGAAELDQQAAQGAQEEQQVVAEVSAQDGGEQTAEAQPSPIGGLAPAAPARRAGPVTIALGQTPEQVVASKGEPITKLSFPNKLIYKYSDMKIIFVNGKVSDVE